MIEGRISVLDRNDVDTDQIIPKQFLKRVERSGFGQFLFHDWVRSGEIELEANPILVTGRNFGSGSSREHAVWSLLDFGFEAVIAASFADGVVEFEIDADVKHRLLHGLDDIGITLRNEAAIAQFEATGGAARGPATTEL